MDSHGLKLRQKKLQQKVQHCMQPPWCESMRHMSSSWEWTCTTTATILVTTLLIHCGNDVIKFSKFVLMSNTVCGIRHHFEAVIITTVRNQFLVSLDFSILFFQKSSNLIFHNLPIFVFCKLFLNLLSFTILPILFFANCNILVFCKGWNFENMKMRKTCRDT